MNAIMTIWARADKFTLRGKWLYAAAVAVALLQSGVMLAGVERRAAILRNGTDVVLRTEPVDPRDLMRGDYVILGYDISNLPLKIFSGTPQNKSGSAYVYVVLEKKSDGIWQAVRGSFDPVQDLSPGQAVIRGMVSTPITGERDSYLLPITYGIERYYVPEGEGREIEDAQRARQVEMVVSLGGNGQPQIKALRMNGQPIYAEPLF